MSIRFTRHLLLPLLALAVTCAAVAPARAQYQHNPNSSGTSATLTINFGTSPHWTTIRGTNVRTIRQSERPDYDIYRYGGRYYVYQNDHWYMSRRGYGQFTMIDERYVPAEFSRVPRAHWRNYPQGWMDRHGRMNNRGRGNDPGRGPAAPGSGGGGNRK